MEIWDLYDRERHLTGRTAVRGERLPRGTYHLVVDILFLNSRGETLLQRRAKDKDVMPDIWSLTGGSAVTGEDSETAMVRETEEEMGFTPDMQNARVLFTDVKERPNGGYIRDVWLVLQDVPLDGMRYQPEEVQDAMWILPEEIQTDEALWQHMCYLSFWEKAFPLLLEESRRIRGLA